MSTESQPSTPRYILSDDKRQRCDRLKQVIAARVPVNPPAYLHDEFFTKANEMFSSIDRAVSKMWSLVERAEFTVPIEFAETLKYLGDERPEDYGARAKTDVQSEWKLLRDTYIATRHLSYAMVKEWLQEPEDPLTDHPVTRGEIATFLARTLQPPLGELELLIAGSLSKSGSVSHERQTQTTVGWMGRGGPQVNSADTDTLWIRTNPAPSTYSGVHDMKESKAEGKDVCATETNGLPSESDLPLSCYCHAM